MVSLRKHIDWHSHYWSEWLSIECLIWWDNQTEKYKDDCNGISLNGFPQNVSFVGTEKYKDDCNVISLNGLPQNIILDGTIKLKKIKDECFKSEWLYIEYLIWWDNQTEKYITMNVIGLNGFPNNISFKNQTEKN